MVQNARVLRQTLECEGVPGVKVYLIALIISRAIQTQLRAWLGREIGRPDTQ